MDRAAFVISPRCPRPPLLQALIPLDDDTVGSSKNSLKRSLLRTVLYYKGVQTNSSSHSDLRTNPPGRTKRDVS